MDVGGECSLEPAVADAALQPFPVEADSDAESVASFGADADRCIASPWEAAASGAGSQLTATVHSLVRAPLPTERHQAPRSGTIVSGRLSSVN